MEEAIAKLDPQVKPGLRSSGHGNGRSAACGTRTNSATGIPILLSQAVTAISPVQVGQAAWCAWWRTTPKHPKP